MSKMSLFCSETEWPMEDFRQWSQQDLFNIPMVIWLKYIAPATTLISQSNQHNILTSMFQSYLRRRAFIIMKKPQTEDASEDLWSLVDEHAVQIVIMLGDSNTLHEVCFIHLPQYYLRLNRRVRVVQALKRIRFHEIITNGWMHPDRCLSIKSNHTELCRARWCCEMTHSMDISGIRLM